MKFLAYLKSTKLLLDYFEVLFESNYPIEVMIYKIHPINQKKSVRKFLTDFYLLK